VANGVLALLIGQITSGVNQFVGRQPFAAGQGVNACRLQPPPVGMGMPTYEKPGHPVGRQSFAAKQSS